MKLLLAMGAFICVGIAQLHGQEPALPKPETQDSAAPAPASPTPAPELIPPDILAPADRAGSPAPAAPNLPGVSQLDEAFKEKPISTAADVAHRHAQWRELQNRVSNSADVKAARRTAEAARTDLEKRKLLGKYYELYFGKMAALTSDPGLKAYMNDRKIEKLNALPQPRVRPTPSPSATKKKT